MCPELPQSALECVRTFSWEKLWMLSHVWQSSFWFMQLCLDGSWDHYCRCVLPVELSWLHLHRHRKELWDGRVRLGPPQHISPTENQSENWEVCNTNSSNLSRCTQQTNVFLWYINWSVEQCVPKELESLPLGRCRAGAECHANLMLIESFLLLCGKYNTWCLHCLISRMSLILTYGVIRLHWWKQRSSHWSQNWCSVQFMLGKCCIFQKDRNPYRRRLPF